MFTRVASLGVGAGGGGGGAGDFGKRSSRMSDRSSDTKLPSDPLPSPNKPLQKMVFLKTRPVRLHVSWWEGGRLQQ